MIKILIPIISAFLFRLGGSEQWKWCKLNQKWWRWGMGFIIGLLLWKGWLAYALAGLSYYIATNIPYGQKSFLNFLGEYGKFAVCGFAFGLASIPLIGVMMGITQGFVSAISWVIIKYYDDKGEIANPLTEQLRGFCGTIVMIGG